MNQKILSKRIADNSLGPHLSFFIVSFSSQKTIGRTELEISCPPFLVMNNSITLLQEHIRTITTVVNTEIKQGKLTETLESKNRSKQTYKLNLRS